MISSTNSIFQQPRGIILAADVPTLDVLRDLVVLSATFPEVVAVKVGFSLALRYGLRAAAEVVSQNSGLPVIYDHQKAGTDVPQMGKPFAEACRDANVQAVIFFPHAGPRTLEAFVSAAKSCQLEPIVGLAMTHPQYFVSEGGYIADSAPDHICKIALDAGVESFVLPGTKPDLIRKFASGNLLKRAPLSILMPGIGSQGGSIRTAFTAATGHRPFGIVGSAIYDASDPSAILRNLIAEMPS